MDGLIVVLAAGALLVRAGQSLYATGLSRPQDAARPAPTRSTTAAGPAARSLFDLCAVTLAFWAVGAAVLFQQRNGWLGLRPSLLLRWRGARGAGGMIAFYEIAILVASGVLAGTLAERSRFFPAGTASIMLAALIVP